MKKSKDFFAAMLVACILAMPETSQAQDYPTRPIQLIVTYAAGGLVDTVGRLFARELGEKLGTQVIVENRPGATNQIGLDAFNLAPPDGYVLMLNTSELTLLPATKKSYRYELLTRIVPVAMVANSWTIFALNPTIEPRTLQELVSYAKAHPGKIRFGSPGVGGQLHIAGELLKAKAGIDLLHVPYRGSSQLANDLIAGHIEMASLGLGNARLADGGKIRVIAQTGPYRHPIVPDVPTTTELGFPDVRMETWYGLFAPPGTNAALIKRLDTVTAEIVKGTSFRQELFNLGIAVSYLPQQDFSRFFAEDLKRWAEIISTVGMPIE